ncbi:MAG: hypothetical protein E7543_03575 [Ruminococcaceae bacterium]|nr:hypothetical protein [Oscillospiraceae bacterium]MBQ9912889.1 hypothetical protein [Clostridia bacterium]
MSEAVTVAIISLFGTLGGSLLGVLASNRLTVYRIEQLEKKVEKHNNLVERTYRIEEEQEVEKEKFKVINHRIEDLEAFHKPK